MSNIEWTQETWNPIAGCTIHSAGCTNCYAMRMAARLEAMHHAGAKGLAHYQGLTQPGKAGPVWTGKIGIAGDDAFLKPLRWKKPRLIFVNSMADLFHDDVPDAVIDKVFAVMAMAPQHTFQILTKRAARMRNYCLEDRLDFIDAEAGTMADWNDMPEETPWPIPNVWLGVSVEDQRAADERIPHLLETPAAVRWISAAPLIGPVDLANPTYPGAGGITMQGFFRDESEWDDFHYWAPKLDWVVVGGESGPGARDNGFLTNARSLRDQCAAAGVPFFGKQGYRKAPLPEDLNIRQWPKEERA